MHSPVMSSNAVKSDKSSVDAGGLALEDVPVVAGPCGALEGVGWSFAGDREGQGSSMDIAGVGEDAVGWTWRLVEESWEAYAAHPNRSMNAIVSFFFYEFLSLLLTTRRGWRRPFRLLPPSRPRLCVDNAVGCGNLSVRWPTSGGSVGFSFKLRHTLRRPPT